MARRPAARASLAVLAVACAGAGCSAGDSTDPTSSPAVVDAGDAGDAASIDPDTDDSLCVLTGSPATVPGESLVFAEDFDGTAVDPTKWAAADGDKGHGTILNTSTPDQAVVRDGSLFITANRTAPGASKPYTAGFLDALGKYSRTYGRFEFRARFPYVPGVWYAIWATPASQPFPEVDIEITNLGASQVWFVNHWAAPPLPADLRRAYVVAPADVKKPEGLDLSQFHTYSMLWKPGLLELSVDGDVRMRRTAVGVPDLPLVWKINAWVGGWGGVPSATTAFPVSFEVDYLHVYRVDGVIAEPSIRIMNKRGTYKTTETIQTAVADFDEVCTHVEMYDGPTRLRTKATAPFNFALSALKAGKHTLTFVATDGARSTVASMDVVIN